MEAPTFVLTKTHDEGVAALTLHAAHPKFARIRHEKRTLVERVAMSA
jgi:hypothetical protein